jgi:hypothetical protein
MDGDTYTIDGVEIPRVTHIISTMLHSRALDAWIERRGKKGAGKVKNKAAIDGTMMHLCCLDSLSDVPLEIPACVSSVGEDFGEMIASRWRAFKSLDLTFGRPRWIEHLLVRKIPPTAAGTTDYWGLIDSKMTVGDLKSSRKKVKKYWYQIGGYYVLGMGMGMPEPEQGMIIYVREDEAEIDLLEKPELVEYGQKFLDIAQLYHETHIVT